MFDKFETKMYLNFALTVKVSPDVVIAGTQISSLRLYMITKYGI